MVPGARAAPGAKLHERVAVIDLGPADGGGVRQRLAAAIVAARLAPVIGEGVEDALAGDSVDRDGVELAGAMDRARRAFGELDCAAATTAAMTATQLAAARVAAGLATPERAKAWSYLLLCAERTGQPDAAMVAAARLRALGGSPEVPREVWDRYPDVDVLAGRDLVEVDITSDAPGAMIWIDDRLAGPAPFHATLAAGAHIVAAATSNSRRGATQVSLAPSKQPIAIAVPTPDVKGTWSEVATRVGRWGGRVPPPAELGWVLARVRARVAIIRYGDTLEVWGQPGRATPPYRLGGEDGVATLAETERVMALIVDRAHVWNDRAPDPDQPLLLETTATPRREAKDEPTRWWVYASIAGAIAAGAIILYVHDTASDTQHVVLDHPRFAP